MDTARLANVIFDRGSKITETMFSSICESIDSDTFTLNEYVLEYKLKESFMGKVPYRLDDGSVVLVSEDFVRKLNTLNIDNTEIETYMRKGYSSFKKLAEALLNGS